MSQTVYYVHDIAVFTVASHGQDYYLDLTELGTWEAENVSNLLRVTQLISGGTYTLIRMLQTLEDFAAQHR